MTEPGKKNKGVSKAKPKKPNYSDETLRKALQDIREEKESIRSACRKYGIPRSTIQDRLHCRVTDGPRRMGPTPVLGLDGEKKLSHYIIEMARRGFPLNKTVLIKTVENIVKETGQKNPFKDGIPGQKWLNAFLKRHPEISLRVSENISKDRALVTEAKIRDWFKNLREYLTEIDALDIFNDADRVLNGDESGFSLCPQTGKVLAPRGYKNVYEVKASKEKENITVLVLFTASGKICPPLVIFPYVRPPRSIVQSMPKQWVLGRSESGWMRGDVFFEYISNDFNNWLIKNKIKKPVLLFVDGHKSHMTIPLSEFCEINVIILYTLPPRTTHMLQPADVSVFRPLKQGWKNTVREFHSQSENPWSSAITKTNFCPLFEKALNTFDMPQHIRNGFKKCGLFPLDEEAVDYTKCVIDNAKSVNRRSSTGITTADIDIAINVIQAANLDSKHGIDTNLILKELNDMKTKTGRRKSTPKRKSAQNSTPKSTSQQKIAQTSTTKSTSQRKSSQKSTPKFTNSPDKNVLILDTPIVGSYVNLGDISVIPLDSSYSLPLNITTNLLTESEFALINNTDLSTNVQIMHTSHESDKTHVSEFSADILCNWKEVNTLDIYSHDIDTQIEKMSKNVQTSLDCASFSRERSEKDTQPILQVQDIDTFHNLTKHTLLDLDSQNEISTSIVTTAQIHEEYPLANRPRSERDSRPIPKIIIASAEGQIQSADSLEHDNLITQLTDKENEGNDKTKPVVRENRKPLEAIDYYDPFVKHLTYPKTESLKSSVQKKQRANVQLPNAISSEAWRKHYEVKEKEKKTKEEAINKRKLLRKEAKENKEKEKIMKRKRITERKNKTNEQTKEQNTKTKSIKKHKVKLSSRRNIHDSDDPDDYCVICGTNYFNKEGPNVEWIQCVRCQKWLHVTCSTNPDICPNCLSV